MKMIEGAALTTRRERERERERGRERGGGVVKMIDSKLCWSIYIYVYFVCMKCK